MYEAAAAVKQREPFRVFPRIKRRTDCVFFTDCAIVRSLIAIVYYSRCSNLLNIVSNSSSAKTIVTHAYSKATEIIKLRSNLSNLTNFMKKNLH